MSVRKLSMVAGRCCWLIFFAMVIARFFADYPFWWTWVPVAAALVLTLAPNRKPAADDGPPTDPVEVAPPVTGRWTALNSPADKVPSHGTRAYGQAYAIDIVAESDEHPRPGPGWWPIARRNRDFPGFGAPLTAVADGTVVRATDRARDHLSRTSVLSALYLLFFEGSIREVGGAGKLVGNHLVLDLGGGTYAMYAHLQRGSLTVREGETVRAGQPVARCGNSGNSSEPHVHFQLMDGPDLDTARGIPFRWHGVGVPRNGEAFTVGATVGKTAIAE
ncbi:murein hydrolase activator EnvC family protein [Streptomyces varsoviensis]|uniref:Peptidase M23 n=1 Tax=Streptomyces varsoviensis TaxID=67373 RepID=A0ABR5IYH1_9ACTN|nr:M23 family metallopeptidase [Streptomyces varsoviensis]KOG86213.1 peptidase M23 [Streptomyces varsoviensis]